MTDKIEFDATLTQYKELYNYECPDGVRHAGWELTLLLDKPPPITGTDITDIKVAFTPVEPELKPCPWCGGEMFLWATEGARLRAMCIDCRKSGPIGNSRLEAIQTHNESVGPEPEPLCPVCGKPASEHCWGLFCCPHCTGEAGVRHTEDSFGHDHAWVQCSGCPAQTKPLGTAAEAAKAWNRRT